MHWRVNRVAADETMVIDQRMNSGERINEMRDHPQLTNNTSLQSLGFVGANVVVFVYT